MMKYTKYLVAGLIACIFSFCAVRAQERKSLVDSPARKLQLAEFAIANLYVDKVDEGKMVEEAIIKMLEQLDPHSVYSDAEDPAPSVGNCKEGQSEYFDVKLTNTGYSVLSIRNIDLGCSCIKLLSDVTKEIKPGSSDFLRFEFFPDRKGVIEREITIVSNAISSFDIIKVRAVVK